MNVNSVTTLLSLLWISNGSTTQIFHGKLRLQRVKGLWSLQIEGENGFEDESQLERIVQFEKNTTINSTVGMTLYEAVRISSQAILRTVWIWNTCRILFRIHTEQELDTLICMKFCPENVGDNVAFPMESLRQNDFPWTK